VKVAGGLNYVTAPMGSHLLAYASAASRDADPDAAGGKTVAADAVLGARRLPGGH